MPLNNEFSMLNSLNVYVRESWEELKKVTWPTRREAISYTGLVIGLSVALALFLGAADYVFTWGLEKFLIR